jgi:ATP-dependent RNA helicase DeaD
MSEGYSAEQIASTLLGMRISKETRSIPEFIKPVPRRENGRGGRGGRTAKIEISLGRQNRIAPNFILGALVDATGMAGKNFGKIDIFDRFTTVEVPEADKEHVIDAMTGTKINGQKIKVKAYEGRGADYGENNQDYKDYRNFRRKNDSGNRRRSDKGRSYKDSHSGNGNRRKRY